MLVVEVVLNEVKSHADADKARHAKGFFKTGEGQYGSGDKFLGVRVPILRKLVSVHKDVALKDALVLLSNEYHEVRLLAIFFMVKLFERAKKSPDHQKQIVDAYLSHTAFVNNWDLVDSSAHKILGVYLLDKNREILYQLAESSSLWERRIAMMATYTFIKQGQFEDTFSLAAILIKDKHDLIHKIVGWMLREVGNIDRAAEQDFLKAHYQQMPRTMLRYAIEKFEKPLRQQYLKGEI